MSQDPNKPVDDSKDLDDDDDEEVPPRVLIATVGDLASWISAPASTTRADRPVWFVIHEDEELVGIFERIPEGKMPEGDSKAILAGLRAFALDRSDDLQRLLGITDGISYGFHVDASLDDVISSFEDDGFELAGDIEDGEVLFDDEDEGEDA